MALLLQLVGRSKEVMGSLKEAKEQEALVVFVRRTLRMPTFSPPSLPWSAPRRDELEFLSLVEFEEEMLLRRAAFAPGPDKSRTRCHRSTSEEGVLEHGVDCVETGPYSSHSQSCGSDPEHHTEAL